MRISSRLKWLAWPLKIAVGVIWLVLVWISSYQILNWTPPPPKPYTPWASLLALFSAAAVWLLKCLKDAREELEEEKFSAPKALALGYLNNWVRPAIDFLLKQPNATDVRFYIFLPETLGQLDNVELQTIRAFIVNQGYRMGQKSVTFSNGQGGNVETVTNAAGTKAIYIDFPKTMKVLSNVVNLKKPVTDSTAQAGLERRLVARFNEIVEAEVGDPGSFLSHHAKIVRVGESVTLHDIPADFWP